MKFLNKNPDSMNMQKIFLVSLLFSFSFFASAQVEFAIGSATSTSGGQVEIQVMTQGFVDIKSMQFSINWDDAIVDLDTVINFSSNIVGFGIGNVGLGVFPDAAVCSWGDEANPSTIPNGQTIFTLVFDVIGQPCDTSIINVSRTPRPIEFIGIVGGSDAELSFSVNSGLIDIPGTNCGGPVNNDLTIQGQMLTAGPNTEICVPFIVTNFDSVESAQFAITWDTSIIKFNRAQNFNVGGAGDGNLVLPGMNQYRFVWGNTAPGNDGVSLVDGSPIFEICFDVAGPVGSMSDISFAEDLFPSEFSSVSNNNLTTRLLPGKVTVGNNSPALILTAVPTSIDMGESGCINITTTNFTDIESFQFSMAWDPTKFMYTNIQDFGFAGLDLGDFGRPPVLSAGQLTAVWGSSSGTGTTLPDGSILFSLCLTALADCDVTDNLQFVGTPAAVEITNGGGEINLTSNNATITTSCNGITITSAGVINESCIGGADGSINIEVEGGTEMFTYSWSPGGFMTQDISNLAPNTYTVTVTDTDGDFISQSYTIAAGTTPCPTTVINLTTSNFNGFGVNCNGDCTGTITTTVVTAVDPITYQWSNNESTPSITGLCAGNYSVTITDGNGEMQVLTADITEPNALSAQISTTEVSSADATDGTAEVVVTGGTEPYSYAWNVNNEVGQMVSNLGRGRVMVLVTDANGCEFLADGNITGGAECYVSREVITPNGDGANDELIIACVQDNPNTLQIFDRWGQLVYAQDNYDNTWSGTDSSGEILDDGAYYWVLDIALSNGLQRIEKGHLTIIRTLD